MHITKTNNRRPWRLALLLPLAALCILASPVIAAGTANSAATRGGTLTVVYVGSNIAGLDPGGPTTSSGVPELDAVFDPLFLPTSNGSTVPNLATGYKTSNAGKTITMTLRHNVKFQDGTPFNAAAVVFNIKRDSSPTQNSECVTYYQTLQSVTAMGQYQVQVTFTRPDPAFLSLVSTQQCALMASPTAVNSEGSNFGLNPVGTGPFILTSYQLTSSSFKKWGGYWQKGYPLANNLNFILVGSDTAALAAVQAGQAQIYLQATPATVTQARTISGLKTAKYDGLAYSETVIFQMGHAPFNNLTARQAVAYAINPTPIEAVVGHGLYLPYKSTIGPGSWAYPGKVPGLLTYNPSKAQALVSQMGGLSFTLMSYNDPTDEQVAQLIQAQCEAVGMKVTINAFPTTQAISNYHSKNYEAGVSGLGGGPVPPNDPDLLFHRWLYSTSPLNQVQIDDPTLDQYLNKATSVFNIQVRKHWYLKVEEQVAKDLPWTGLYTETYWAIESKSVKGFIPGFAFQNYYDTSAS